MCSQVHCHTLERNILHNTILLIFLTIKHRLEAQSEKHSNKAKYLSAEHIDSKCSALKPSVGLEFFPHFLGLHERGSEPERSPL